MSAPEHDASAPPAENPESAASTDRRIEPKMFRASVGGKTVIVVALTRRGAASGLAREMANEIEKSLVQLSAVEAFRAGSSGVPTIDVTKDDAKPIDEGSGQEA